MRRPTRVAGGHRFADIHLPSRSATACGRKTDGEAWCWGGAFGGEPERLPGSYRFTALRTGHFYFCGITAGDSTTLCWRDSIVTPLGAPLQLRDIAPGDLHDCGLTASGEAWCWQSLGWFASGPVGARRVDGGHRFTSISVGGDACGLKADGSAWCWYLWGPWSPVPIDTITFQQLDRGTCGISTGGRSYCWRVGPPQSAPTPVDGGRSFTTASFGWWHKCGIDASGAAWCWGENGRGELGDGSLARRDAPVTVQGAPTMRAIATSQMVTCGLDSDSAAWCWGTSNTGVIGDGVPLERPSPVRVVGGLSFTEVSVAGGMGCGMASDGRAYCWGEHAELDGSPAPRAGLAPSLVSLSARGSRACGLSQGGQLTCAEVAEPAPALRLREFALGSEHTCGIDVDGTTWCWGQNYRGLLGDSTVTASSTPVRVHGDPPFVAIGAAGDMTCGLTAAGTVACWGGLHSHYSALVPVLIPGDYRFVQIAIGGSRGCGLAEDGRAFCWASGEDNDWRPTAVAGDMRFTTLTAADRWTCGLTTAGEAWCWGDNDRGQLGDGTFTRRLTPVRVAGGLTFRTP